MVLKDLFEKRLNGIGYRGLFLIGNKYNKESLVQFLISNGYRSHDNFNPTGIVFYITHKSIKDMSYYRFIYEDYKRIYSLDNSYTHVIFTEERYNIDDIVKNINTIKDKLV